MSRLRVDRLLTWIAVVFLIAGVAGAGAAWPRPSPMTLAPPVPGEANRPRIEVELLGPAFKEFERADGNRIGDHGWIG